MNSAHNATPARTDQCTPDQDFERLRRIDELKHKIQAGTYLINKYEIIDGLLNELASAATPMGGGD